MAQAPGWGDRATTEHFWGSGFTAPREPGVPSSIAGLALAVLGWVSLSSELSLPLHGCQWVRTH